MMPAPIETTRKLLEDAINYYEQKKYTDAEKSVEKLIGVNSDFHRGWFLKGIILEETGRATEAKECFAKSGNVHTLMLRLAIQLMDKDPQRAIVYFDRALSEDPGSNIILFHRGLLAEKAGDMEEARRFYRKLSPGREFFSRIVSPAGFMVFLIVGAAMMFRRGDRVLSWIVLASAIVCLFWLKRDGGLAIQMLRKKMFFK